MKTTNRKINKGLIFLIIVTICVWGALIFLFYKLHTLIDTPIAF